MWVIAIILLRNHKSRAVIKSPQGSLTHFTLLPVLLLALITLYRFQKSVRFGILKKTLISYGRYLVNRPSVVKSGVKPVISVILSDPSVRNLHS